MNVAVKLKALSTGLPLSFGTWAYAGGIDFRRFRTPSPPILILGLYTKRRCI